MVRRLFFTSIGGRPQPDDWFMYSLDGAIYHVRRRGKFAVINMPALPGWCQGPARLLLWAVWSSWDEGRRIIFMGQFTQKASENAKTRSVGGSVTDKTFATKFPALWDFLTDCSVVNGKPRLTTAFTFSLDAGLLKMRINDRQRGLYAFVSSESFQGLLDAVEDGLKEDCLDWREDTFTKVKRGK